MNASLTWCDTHGCNDSGSWYHVWSKSCVLLCSKGIRCVSPPRCDLMEQIQVWFFVERCVFNVCKTIYVFLRQATKNVCVCVYMYLSIIIDTLSWIHCQHCDDKTNTGHRTDRRVNTDWTCPQTLHMFVCLFVCVC